MRDFRDSKTMAQSLRRALSDQKVTISHSESLELIAKAFGLDNWNVLAAKIDAELPTTTRPEAATPAKGGTLYCSFCGKSQYDVKRLIAGPTVFICNECVGLCDGIMLEGEIADLLGVERAKRPEADALDIARLAFSAFSDEQLERCRATIAKDLEYLDWSIRQTTAALGREPMQWIPDDLARERRWTSDPLKGKSREQVIEQRAYLELRSAKVHQDADLVERVLRERGVDRSGPNPPAG